jgi:hypothetical protein
VRVIKAWVRDYVGALNLCPWALESQSVTSIEVLRGPVSVPVPVFEEKGEVSQMDFAGTVVQGSEEGRDNDALLRALLLTTFDLLDHASDSSDSDTSSRAGSRSRTRTKLVALPDLQHSFVDFLVVVDDFQALLEHEVSLALPLPSLLLHYHTHTQRCTLSYRVTAATASYQFLSLSHLLLLHSSPLLILGPLGPRVSRRLSASPMLTPIHTCVPCTTHIIFPLPSFLAVARSK